MTSTERLSPRTINFSGFRHIKMGWEYTKGKQKPSLFLSI